MVKDGLVDSTIGRSGGYRLARKTADISILSIVEAIDGNTRRTTCVLSAGPCSREKGCDVHAIFMAGQQALIDELARASLDDALSNERPRRRSDAA